MEDNMALYAPESPNVRLNSNLCLPSSVHGYSMGVEYMRDWFLSKFKDDFFKTVHVNGKHAFTDYKSMGRGNLATIQKPAVGIVPQIDLQHDRDFRDIYMMHTDSWLNKYNHSKSFFKDSENNTYLNFNLRELEIGLNFKCRVSTLAQQIDLYRYMEMQFRIGCTETVRIDMDFHIPTELMLNIATHAGFEVVNDRVTDIDSFVRYLNSKSTFPIIYKLRAINGNNEFFVRVPEVICHINVSEKLSADTGEREGMLDNNFHVEMNVIFRLHVPHFYVYKSIKKIMHSIPPMDGNMVGIYSFKLVDIPEINEFGWNLYMQTGYDFNKEDIIGSMVDIDLSEVLSNDVKKIIKQSMDIGVLPSSFINVKLYNWKEDDECYIDWDKCMLTVPKVESSRIFIAIYIDKIFLNEQLLTISYNKK